MPRDCWSRKYANFYFFTPVRQPASSKCTKLDENVAELITNWKIRLDDDGFNNRIL